MTAPTSTTNMTGFFINVRGSSFINESRTAPPAIPHVQSDFFRSRDGLPKPGSGIVVGGSGLFCLVDCMVMVASKDLSSVHQQVLENRPEAERWEEGKCADDQNYRDQQRGEKRRRHRERASRCGHELLACQAPSDGHDRH